MLFRAMPLLSAGQTGLAGLIASSYSLILCLCSARTSDGLARIRFLSILLAGGRRVDNPLAATSPTNPLSVGVPPVGSVISKVGMIHEY
jgi:hypothetical protein